MRRWNLARMTDEPQPSRVEEEMFHVEQREGHVPRGTPEEMLCILGRNRVSGTCQGLGDGRGGWGRLRKICRERVGRVRKPMDLSGDGLLSGSHVLPAVGGAE